MTLYEIVSTSLTTSQAISKVLGQFVITVYRSCRVEQGEQEFPIWPGNAGVPGYGVPGFLTNTNLSAHHYSGSCPLAHWVLHHTPSTAKQKEFSIENWIFVNAEN